MNIRRILLLVPPVTRPTDYGADRMRVSPFFPLGLAYLAAVLRDRYDVRVLDCLTEGIERGVSRDAVGRLRYGLADWEIRMAIDAYNPDVVGVSCLFSAQEWDARNVCRIAKELHPRIMTVLGGPHAGANAREIMESEAAVDYVVSGEGEQAFPELLKQLGGGEGIVQAAYYRHDGQVHECPRFGYLSDLDTIPFPAWDMLDMPRYSRLMVPHDRCRQRPFMPVTTSRGCPYRCGFCAIRRHWGEQPRFRSADNVLAEISILHDRYGVREVHFEDDNLTAHKARALAIFKGIQVMAPGLTWAAPSGLAMRNLDGELLDAMAESGCYSVSLAIENGSQDILRLMRKPVDLARVPGLVREIQQRGMLAKGFFILGYPGETRDTILRTVEFAKSLELDWSFFFIASPLPHTEMWERAVAAGMIQPGDWNALTSMHEPMLRLPGVDPGWLKEVQERANVECNFANNPNLTRNPAQAAADFEHVLGLYPHLAHAREALERAREAASA